MTQETEEIKYHPNWLRFMYAYTIVVAGAIGLLFLIIPSTMLSILGVPTQEPIVAGALYSVFLAFSIVSIFGLRSPLKFAPVLLPQFTYKVIWFISVIAPKAVSGGLPPFAITMSILWAPWVIGGLIALPWKYLFAKSK